MKNLQKDSMAHASLKIKNFGGWAGWYLKKAFPRAAAFFYIQVNFVARRRRTQNYIRWFLKQEKTPHPMVVEIETINRCNSTCEFCPANKNDDKRPFAKLSDEDFKKVIMDLKEWNYDGLISLYVNNEPLIDKRIVELHRYVREHLPKCKVKFFTNGTLLTMEKFRELIPYIDYMVINNYGTTMKLHPNIQKIVSEVRSHKEEYNGKEIVINIRYIKDVLTNRAGEAPNKKGNTKIIKEPCIMPYTDMTIFSTGNVGICCNDATEKSYFGNIREKSLQEIWESSCGFTRMKMKKGRYGMDFCKYCDTMDSGYRMKLLKQREREDDI